MKPSQAPKQLPQVRIIRGNRPDGYPKLFDERLDSPIRSVSINKNEYIQ